MSKKNANSKIANPYAEALFQLGLSLYMKEDNPDVFYKLIFDIQDLLKVLSENPVLEEYLSNPIVASKDKKAILEKCFTGKLSSNTMNFLSLLIDKKRISSIELIGKKFLEKAYDFVCIKFVEVWSTIELTTKQQKALTNKINEMLGPVFTEPYVQSANIQLTLRIDNKILGGLVIKIGSKVIDLSLRGELQGLAKQLDIMI
jgi:F-type H+-transporting ATPase subunit delta